MGLRLIVVAALAAVVACARAEPRAPYDVEEKSVRELQADLASGRTTSEALVTAYLERIARLDRAGPTLRSVLATNPDALAQARALDLERAGGRTRGPLHGIPILVKDNIETLDPMPTTAGSLALTANLTHRDAPAIARLRTAGAIVLGKTNLSEWANIRSSQSTSGWSAVGGLTRNPYALDRNTCGSSSGSGAATAASLAAGAIGTERKVRSSDGHPSLRDELQQSVQIQRTGEHRKRTSVVSGPLLGRPVPIQLHAVVVRVSQIRTVGNQVIGIGSYFGPAFLRTVKGGNEGAFALHFPTEVIEPRELSSPAGRLLVAIATDYRALGDLDEAYVVVRIAV
jgi:hypothetical protein